MQLWWGTYSFPVNAAEVTSQAQTVFSYSGRPLRYVLGYNVTVTLLGSTQRALSTLEDNLRAALNRPYQDLVLKCDDGSQSSAKLINSQSVTGVRLKTGPSFGEAQGGEFVNRRTASFSMEAEYMIVGAENAIVSWTESVTIQGNGGPARFWRFPVNNANPIRQVKTRQSLVTATQSGMAVGHTQRPNRPSPIWPDFLVNEADTTGSDTPEPKGLAYLNHPVKWSYTFHSGGIPLIGFPSLPPMP